MSEPPGAFYVVDAQATDHADVTPTRHCAGPWSPLAQHGGPPIALMARQAARVGTDGRVPMRVTADLLGAVPMGPLRVTARVVRSGRSVELVEADLTDLQRHRVVARAALWLAPWTTGLPATPTPAPLACVDSASGASAALDVRQWQFMNTEHGRRAGRGRGFRPRRHRRPDRPGAAGAARLTGYGVVTYASVG